MLTDTVADLTRTDYELLRELVYRQSGINLGDQKMQLVRARLGKRLRQGGFGSYREYYQYVKNDLSGHELSALLDAISTNTTHLFREIRHFEFLGEMLTRWMADDRAASRPKTLRIWSAGCSSGEEPYSIAMTVADILGPAASTRAKILATDISKAVLAQARAGVYSNEQMANVPKGYRPRFFTRIQDPDAPRWAVRPEIKCLVTFARFNLMATRFPFRHKFDLIFCRNVMIYFDRPTQEALVGRFAEQLAPGGYLLIGHSESLNSIRHPLTYVRPTIYRKLPDG